MRQFDQAYPEILGTENLLLSWEEFLRGKRSRNDVALFQLRLMDNIHVLRRALLGKTYVHGGYQAFNISDPKPRNIHKATVRDRLLHHLIYRALYPYFDRVFIHDSYSCRVGKGTHRAQDRFDQFAARVSQNHTRTAWVLKCDIRKFFASIDQAVLKEILHRHIADADLRWLLGQVIDSFHVDGAPGAGLPLGNLTSQLLVNVYMNEFDQFVKRDLKARYYIRYADDFVFFSEDKEYLASLLPRVEEFLVNRLKLKLHPGKVSLETVASGVDFLGWVHFSRHRVLRTTTKRRMLARLKKGTSAASLTSYSGLLKQGSAYKLRSRIGFTDDE